jgi:type IV secretory pathway TrbD component
MSDNNIPGYHIPIHKSLTEEIHLGGVPRDFAIVNGAIGGALGIGGGSWYIIPLFVFVHICLAYAHKKDAQFIDCLRRYFYHAKYYGT